MRAARACMIQNFLQLKNAFYRIENGTCMGNLLSPIIDIVYMAKLEMKLKERKLLRKFCTTRYVDDVCALIKRSEPNNLLTAK